MKRFKAALLTIALFTSGAVTHAQAQREPALADKILQRGIAITRKACLEAVGRVVEPGMKDPAVAAAAMPPQLSLLVYYRDRCSGMSPLQVQRHVDSNDAAAYNEIVYRSRHHSPSFRIQPGSIESANSS